MKTGWNNKTPTSVIHEAYKGKTALLQWWEEQPTKVQAKNAKDIADLTRRIRQIRVYLQHRKDAPVII